MKKPDRLFVIPRRGAIVRKSPKEGLAILREDGESVPNSPYWRRRLRGGDVSLGQEKPALHKAESQPSKAKGAKE